MNKEKINQLHTELDGLEFVIKDTKLNLEVVLKRLQEVRELLEDKKDEF